MTTEDKELESLIITSNSFEKQALDLVAENEALKAQVNEWDNAFYFYLSNNASSHKLLEVYNKTSEQCLNSVKISAVNEFIELVINDDVKNAGLGGLLRLLQSKQ